jgi:hypothetical protein
MGWCWSIVGQAKIKWLQDRSGVLYRVAMYGRIRWSWGEPPAVDRTRTADAVRAVIARAAGTGGRVAPAGGGAVIENRLFLLL